MSQPAINYQAVAEKIKLWGHELGFEKVGITDVDLHEHEAYLEKWLDQGFHGDMDYMARHGTMRARPDELLPGTVRVISVRMNYLPENAQFAATLKDPQKAYISRYALGRDYHKTLRNRLKKLGDKIETLVDELGFRPFVDSAPILERPLAEKAGLGWVGKHSLLLDESDGSWFFLGELLVNIPLPTDEKLENQCGSCVACMTICPTQAIVSPYVVDGRRCISYLTIELKTAIPVEFREPMGNRIYGCDDCQLICPYNRESSLSTQEDFTPREQLHHMDLLALFAWTESEFLKITEGSPIRRIGYECWQRNIAVALGNAPASEEIINALTNKKGQVSDMVDEHIDWALTRHLQHIPVKQENTRQQARLVRVIEKGLPRDA